MDINAHRKTPHISTEAYTKQRHLELGESLDGRFPLYLDQNYWIALRNAEASAGNSGETELLRLLRQLTAAGNVFCPISESVLMELLKQGDLDSRLRTARLIDDLSSGVSLIPFDVRAATELAHFIHSYNSDPSRLHPLRHLVWSKPSCALGIAHLSIDTFDEETKLAVEKAFFDEMWSTPLGEMIKIIGNAPLPDHMGPSNLAAKLNTENAEHAEELHSFAQAYVAESRGAASVFGETLMAIVRDMAIQGGTPFPPQDCDEWKLQRKMWENLLFQILQGKPERTRLPSIHIHACLHAAIRWDKSRRLEANDFYDFHHASAALGFCKAFFTERSLRSLIKANHIGLDKLYECKVVAKISGAIEFLEELNRVLADSPNVSKR